MDERVKTWIHQTKNEMKKKTNIRYMFSTVYSYLTLYHVTKKKYTRRKTIVCMAHHFPCGFRSNFVVCFSTYFFFFFCFLCRGLRRPNWVQILMGLMCHLFFLFDLFSTILFVLSLLEKHHLAHYGIEQPRLQKLWFFFNFVSTSRCVKTQSTKWLNKKHNIIKKIM